MKRVIGIFLCINMLLCIMPIHAENLEMSVEVVSSEIVQTEEADLQLQIEGTDSESGEDNVNLLEMHTESEIDELTFSVDDNWSKTVELSARMVVAESCMVNGELYIVGGIRQTGFSYSIQKYDATNRIWSTVSDFDMKIKGYSIVVVGGKIYIVGGYTDGVYQNTVQVYNTETNEWSYLPQMLNRREGAATLYTDNKLYVFGGRNALGIVSSYEYYDFETGNWNLVTIGYDDSIIRVGAKAKYVDGYVCIYGGYDKDCIPQGMDAYYSQDMKAQKQLIAKPCDGVDCNDGECEHIYYDDISIAWGENKGIIFLNDSSTNEAIIKEVSRDNGELYVSDIAFTDNELKGKFSNYIIYNGYLHCIGGWNITSHSYKKEVYKYSVYYGDYSESDGTISSVVTESGNSITMNVENGREYMLFVNGPASDDYIYTIEYPEDTFTVVDTCAMTVEENEIGNINGTDIVVLESDNNGVSFKTIEMPPESGVLTKTVNAVILKATSPGQRTITYAMTIDEEANE